VRSSASQAVKAPSVLLNRATHLIPTTFRYQTILAARGIVVSYETIREWSLRFGRAYANSLKMRRPKPGDKWFLNEVFVRI
jgi:putative transposase